ncbi:MAG: PQQ-binding-like beta-propeller repeat protein [Planctomycetes bacterium]|nr:PQQ-binding-like beta-propeller repeat protein [Planctomycetota bacterium]
MSPLALALLLTVGQTSTVSPADTWPQWRGPTNDSHAPGDNLPIKWSKTDNIVWKTSIPGWGTSTPAIWRDAVFVTTQDADRLLFLRINAGTGKIDWQRDVGRGTPRRKGALGNLRFHDEHNMASPSPVTDGKHVWIHFGNGDLACFDFTGKKVWDANLAKDYGFYSIWWGHANSPLLVGDLLISVCMQDPKNNGKSYLVAHDKLTGKEKWHTPRVTGATSEPADSYTTPLLFNNKGRGELIIFGGNVLDAYDPATGRQLWQARPFKGNRVISGPTLAGDTVYAVQGMKGPLFAVKVGGKGDITKSNVQWKYTGATPDAASPVYANGLVFLCNNAGVVTCVDAKTGDEVWKERLGQAFRATPLVAGERVYFFSKEGTAFIIEAARQLKVLSRVELGEDIMASPAAASGSLFIRTREHLWRIGKVR